MAIEDTSRLMQVYVEKAVADLPALPTAVIEIIRATESEPINMHHVEDMVGSEPAIASKLLRVVNSAYFGLPREVVSIGQALTILGLHQLRNIVLGIGVFNTLNETRYGTDSVVRAIWSRSFGTAACASILARTTRRSQKEQELLFVAGLLHDIGMLFYLSNFTSIYSTLLQKSTTEKADLAELERLVLHLDHARLGALLADKWELPFELVDLIGSHEDYTTSTNPDCARILYIADRIVYQIQEETAICTQTPLQNEDKKFLRISDPEFEELTLEVRERVDKAGELLGVLS